MRRRRDQLPSDEDDIEEFQRRPVPPQPIDTVIVHTTTDPPKVSTMLDELDPVNTYLGDLEPERIDVRTLGLDSPDIQLSLALGSHPGTQHYVQTTQMVQQQLQGMDAQIPRRVMDRHTTDMQNVQSPKRNQTIHIMAFLLHTETHSYLPDEFYSNFRQGLSMHDILYTCWFSVPYFESMIQIILNLRHLRTLWMNDARRFDRLYRYYTTVMIVRCLWPVAMIGSLSVGPDALITAIGMWVTATNIFQYVIENFDYQKAATSYFMAVNAMNNSAPSDANRNIVLARAHAAQATRDVIRKIIEINKHCGIDGLELILSSWNVFTTDVTHTKVSSVSTNFVSPDVLYWSYDGRKALEENENWKIANVNQLFPKFSYPTVFVSTIQNLPWTPSALIHYIMDVSKKPLQMDRLRTTMGGNINALYLHESEGDTDIGENDDDE